MMTFAVGDAVRSKRYCTVGEVVGSRGEYVLVKWCWLEQVFPVRPDGLEKIDRAA